MRKKQILSIFLILIMITAIFGNISLRVADLSDLYPYTIFAFSTEEGGISFNADNVCVNGNVATNGTLISTGNININGITCIVILHLIFYDFCQNVEMK